MLVFLGTATASFLATTSATHPHLDALAQTTRLARLPPMFIDRARVGRRTHVINGTCSQGATCYVTKDAHAHAKITAINLVNPTGKT